MASKGLLICNYFFETSSSGAPRLRAGGFPISSYYYTNTSSSDLSSLTALKFVIFMLNLAALAVVSSLAFYIIYSFITSRSC